MKALVKLQRGPGNMELREVPMPRAASGEVLLRIDAVGICGTDLHIQAGEYPSNPPVTLGHEFTGTIVELGENVTGWQVGDRVTSMPYAILCGTCRHCRNGNFGLCDKRQSYGSGVDGAFASYLTVKVSGLFHLPDHIDATAGALTEPLACVTKAVFETDSLREGERALVIGPGPIGLLTTQVAHFAGARVYLIGLKRDAARLELGLSLGASQTFVVDDPEFMQQITDALGDDGADVIYECSGASSGFELALKLVRKQGRVNQVGLFGKPITALLDPIVFKELTIRGSFASSRSSWERALQLMRDRQLDTTPLISDIFALPDWQQAFAHAASGRGLKVVLRPG